MSHFNDNEFISINNDEKNSIFSGGFSVNSIMMGKGISPIKTLNRPFNDKLEDDQSGGKVSDLFDHLVVPNWAYTNGIKSGGSSDSFSSEEYINDDLHDKLIGLVEHSDDNTSKGGKTKTKTKKKKNKNKKNKMSKTKRNK